MSNLNLDLATCPLSAVNTSDPEFLQDPHPFYARLRREAPVFRDETAGIVFINTYDLVKKICAQPKLFSNKFGEQLKSGAATDQDPEEVAIQETGWIIEDTMLTADPPEHTRYRKLCMKAFSYKRVMQMSDYVETLINELIDDLPQSGKLEFKSGFATKLPMYVIADALGVPREKYGHFEEWSNAFIVQLSGIAEKPQRLWAARKVVEFQKYFVEVIEEKRVNPTEDVISDLVHADLSEEGDNRKMVYEELLSIIQQLLVAGIETTAHTLTAGLYYLLTHPKQMEALITDPSLVNNFVEETLRYLSPTNNMWRVAKEDTEVEGVKIKKNELLLLRFGSSNRDENKFTNPDAFDLNRENAAEHLAFGAGIHTCIGAQLARKEMQKAFPILLQRLKNIKLDTSQGDLVYLPSVLLRGVLELHIEYEKV